MIAIGSPFLGITIKFIVEPGGHPGGESEFPRYRVLPGREVMNASFSSRFFLISFHLLS